MLCMHKFSTVLAYFSSGVKGDTGGGVGDAEMQAIHNHLI